MSFRLTKDERKYMDDVLSSYRPMDISFPYDEYVSSCLIYNKGNYGIFMIQNRKGELYTVKVSLYTIKNDEINISLYIKQNASHIPNILHVENIYRGSNPLDYPLFRYSSLENGLCKNKPLEDIFIHNRYYYYLTKSCMGNLSYYTGTLKQKITYQQFVGYSFQVLVGLQTLHSLNIWHSDIKPANFLICNSDISPYFNNIIYKTQPNIEEFNYSWAFSYQDLQNKDIKLIDYGEAIYLENNKIPCDKYGYEVKVALVNVIDILWKSIIGDKDEDKVNKFNDFRNNLKTCTTDLLDVMINSFIFHDNLSDFTENPTDYIVPLL
jgi:serine/threonine protein kinase